MEHISAVLISSSLRRGCLSFLGPWIPETRALRHFQLKGKQNKTHKTLGPPAHIQPHLKSSLVSAAPLVQKQAYSLAQQISLYSSLHTRLQWLGAFAGQATAVAFWAFTEPGLENMDTNAYHRFWETSALVHIRGLRHWKLSAHLHACSYHSLWIALKVLDTWKFSYWSKTKVLPTHTPQWSREKKKSR